MGFKSTVSPAEPRPILLVIAKSPALAFDTHELLLQLSVLARFRRCVCALQRAEKISLRPQQVAVDEVAGDAGTVCGHPVLALRNRADRELLNQELTKIEKPAGIANPKDFRNEVVKFTLRARANHGGRNPSWTSYEKLREVIERRMFSQVEELLPVISFGSKKDSDSERKHDEFVTRMMARGYTERQVRRLVEWYMRVKQAG